MTNDPAPHARADAADWTLDPADNWDDLRADAHRALDAMIDHMRGVRERPVWREAPQDVRDHFAVPLPHAGRDLALVLDDFTRNIVPFANGNDHPMFMGWVHGAGSPVGMVAEMLAGGLNSNCGGRNHIAIEVERQITRWMAEVLGFPADSSGLFVTGTSMANFLAVLIARDRALGHVVRERGLGEHGARLTAYTSVQAHGCVSQALQLAGIGSDRLRGIATDGTGAIRLDLLTAAIDADRGAGLTPFLVVGTAGSVNTGAIDDLGALAGICQAEALWFHVDGAFGALAALAPELKPLIAGIERADTVAFDFHKWLHVPYDAGFLICRDQAIHLGTFSDDVAYLKRAPRGLAAGGVWPTDLGPDLSRGFRALKTWFQFQVYGADRLGAAITGTCRVARHLQGLIERSEQFEMRAPVALNIVCFSAKGPGADGLNQQIVMDLHDAGLAAPSITTLDGRAVIRCAIINHRTTAADMERFLAAAEALAGRLR